MGRLRSEVTVEEKEEEVREELDGRSEAQQWRREEEIIRSEERVSEKEQTVRGFSRRNWGTVRDVIPEILEAAWEVEKGV